MVWAGRNVSVLAFIRMCSDAYFCYNTRNSTRTSAFASIYLLVPRLVALEGLLGAAHAHDLRGVGPQRAKLARRERRLAQRRRR